MTSLAERLALETLRALLRLDAHTGNLYWLVGRRGHARAGMEALTAYQDGYRRGKINGVDCAAHRVVFALANGRWPVGDVDHIDGNRSNNRPENLREATRQENLRNMRRRPSGSSRFKGVSLAGGRWVARARSGSVRHHLGSYADEEAAARAYDAFAAAHFGRFARLNFPSEAAR